MIRQKFTTPLTLILLIGLATNTNASPRPNIILIVADDVGYGDLGSYGQSLIKTPHLDKLAEQGLRFTQAYAGGPVCTPSRSALMTGLHNGHTPARDNIPHYKTYLDEDDITMAMVLRDAGYRCAGFGKWSLGDAGTVGRATNKGFEKWFGYLNQDHAHYYYPEYLDDDEGRLELTGNTQSRAHYSHDLIVSRTLEFLKSQQEDPFFLYCAFTLPHFASRSEDPDRLTVPSTEPYTNEAWDEGSKKYAAMIHRLDEDVGKIVALVDELGMKDNTLIIFTSDNGGHEEMSGRFNSSGPLRGFKRDMTEGGVRVPFIARWPGFVPQGKTSEEIIAFWDLLPTFAELAGTTVPPDIDGTSVMGTLEGGSVENPREYLYWDYGHCRDRYDQAVRLGNWKGIRLGATGDVQLYDLASDLAEENDVSSTHEGVVSRIEEIMREAVTASPRYRIGEIYEGRAIWQKDPRP